MSRKAKPAKKIVSTAEWDALIARHPLEGRWALPQRIVMTLVANGLLAYLLAKGQIQPLYLVLLVAIEAMMLNSVEIVQLLSVPRSSQPPDEERISPVPRFFVLALCMIALLFFNGMVILGMLDAEDAVLAFVRHPWESLRQAQLGLLLAITLVTALIDGVRDARYFAVHGGYFISTPGWNARARWMTLCLGVLPHAIPILGTLWIVGKYFQGRAKRSLAVEGGELPPVPKLAIVALAALGAAAFFSVSWLVSAGLAGWTVAFCAAKFTSEMFVVSLPLFAAKRRAEVLAEA